MKIPHAFDRVSVLVIGDLMLDRFVAGSVDRISPESPVPVMSIRRTSVFAGGAANVARNIATLGSRCTLVGVVGNDGAGKELIAALDTRDGIDAALVVDDARMTTEKVRFVAQGQQLLRVDAEETEPLNAVLERRVLEQIGTHIADHQVMVLSDYAKGMLTPTIVRGAISLARKHHMPVIVDPKSVDLARYSGATVITPNAKEVHASTGLDPAEDDVIAEEAGHRILAASGIESVLVTRAHRGMTLVSRTHPSIHLKARAREVFDVVGAGDTVVATLAVALGAGEPLPAAATLANVAAGIVVGKRGTATVKRHELDQELVRIAHEHMAPVRSKIIGEDELDEHIASWREQGYAVGIVRDRFETIDAGIVSRLHLARSNCDRLVVFVEAHEQVAEDERLVLVAALSAVDAVVLVSQGSLMGLVPGATTAHAIHDGASATARVA